MTLVLIGGNSERPPLGYLLLRLRSFAMHSALIWKRGDGVLTFFYSIEKYAGSDGIQKHIGVTASSPYNIA
jgi:hypothetical protein